MTIKIRGGAVYLKESCTQTMHKYINFLISHHNYGYKAFDKARGTALWGSIEKLEEMK